MAVKVERRSDGNLACTLGDPGPFIVITTVQALGLVQQLALLGVIRRYDK